MLCIGGRLNGIILVTDFFFFFRLVLLFDFGFDLTVGLITKAFLLSPGFQLSPLVSEFRLPVGLGFNIELVISSTNILYNVFLNNATVNICRH